MSTKQLQHNIIDKISGVTDPEVLKAIDKLINKLVTDSEATKLTDEQRAFINESLQELEEGRVIDEGVIREEEDKWLKE